MPILNEPFFYRGIDHVAKHLRIKDVPDIYSLEILKLFVGKPNLLYSAVVTRILSSYEGFRMPTVKVWKEYRDTAIQVDAYSRLKPIETKAIDYHGENQVVIDRTVKRFNEEHSDICMDLVVNGEVVTPRQRAASLAYFKILTAEFKAVHGQGMFDGIGA